jgi:hypothetical protein
MTTISLNEYLKLAQFYRDTLDYYIAPVEKPIVSVDGVVEKYKGGKEKYYKVMPIHYKGRYHGKDDYLRHVDDTEIEEWYNEGFGLAVIAKGWSEKHKKFQRVFDIDAFGSMNKAEFWKKYEDVLCHCFVTESFKGYHVFVMSDIEMNISKFTIETPLGDILTGDVRYGTKSGHTVEPPSLSVNDTTWTINGRYTVANYTDTPEDLPEGWKVTNFSTVKTTATKIKVDEGVDVIRQMLEGKSKKGTGQGVYDINLKYIGTQVGKIKDKENPDDVKKALDKVVSFNEKHFEGYSEESVKDTFFDLLKKETKKTKMDKVEVDMDIVERAGGSIIKDNTDGEIYIQIDGKHNHKLKGSSAKRWIIQVIEPKDNAQVNNLMMRLDAKIAHSTKLQYRITRNSDGFICYNIGDDKGNVVTVKNGRWEVGESPDIRLFKPCSGMKEQMFPVGGGSVHDIFDFINIDERMRPLFLCVLIFYFIPDVQYPVLNMFGAKGSGKSTGALFVRNLVDPNQADFDTIDSKKIEDTRVALSSSHLSVIDNISNISQDLSDLLCVLSTGGAHRKRVLYTDGDVHISQIIKPVILTSVSQEIRREDLLSRTVLAEVHKINKTQAPIVLHKEFKAKLPYILGGIFDVLSKIDVEGVSKDGLVRMADFHMYARAIGEVLGFGGVIDELVQENFMQQEEEAVSNSDTGGAIMSYMSNKAEADHTASEWVKILGDIDFTFKKKQANWFSRDMKRLEGSLLSVGLVVEFDRDMIKKTIRIVNKNTIVSGDFIGSGFEGYLS